MKDKIIVTVLENDMKAKVAFNLTVEELHMDNRERLVKETALKLRESGISFGIKGDLFSKELDPGVEYPIAEGVYPENGRDSVINMYEITEDKPETNQDDKVDYYNMSLIKTVPENTLLGERLEAEEGTDGKSVRGEKVKALKGQTFRLKYDEKWVYEKQEGNKTLIYSKCYGAVYFKPNGEIALMNPLVIDGDVNFKTGNIMFDGFVIIKGTVYDGFYVEATKDIEINGEMGVGNAKGIVSSQGSIFIKGGVLSKGGTEIRAAKNIYTKFADNTSVSCGETAHIGFYCANSMIRAKEVVLDSFNGQILGGTIKAETRVISPIFGSELEKTVIVEVSGFDKEAMKRQVEEIKKNIELLKKEYDNVKGTIAYLLRHSPLSTFQQRLYTESCKRLEEIKEEFKSLGDKKQSYDCYMKTKGEGEITASHRIYPNCKFTIRKKTIDIERLTYATSYFVNGGKLIKV